MKFLSAAGPAIRRRLRPPQFDVLEPDHVVNFHEGLLADVYVPDAAEGAPNALILHGGGFVLGSRDMSAVRVLASYLVAQGFVVASVDYRLAYPWTRVRLAEQEQDVKAAASWWKASVGEFGGDADRTALFGLSAGGALALLASPDAHFQRFVGIYGAYDLELLPVKWASASILTRTAKAEVRASRSPIGRAGFAQPVLIVHGTKDTLTPPRQAERFAEVRAEQGLPTETVWVEGGVHGYLQEGPEDPHAQQSLVAIGEFLADL